MNPPPVSEATDIAALARELAPRFNEVEATYEQLRKRRGAGRPFIIVMEGATSDEAAIAMVLRKVQAEGWLSDLSDALLRGIGFADNESGALTRLQGVVRPAFGFADLADVEAGVAQARIRVCKVDVAKGPGHEATSGSGFLVGPSVLLTSFHVVAGLLTKVGDKLYQAKPGSAAFLTAMFDFATDQESGDGYRVPDEWLVASSPALDAELGTGAHNLGDEVNFDGHLDYAAILVAGFPGGERGFYDLNKSAEPQPGGAVHLMQHPLELKQRYAQGAVIGFRPGTVDRLLHSANSSSGSSGGQLLDNNFKLIGLHQGEVPASATQGVTNTAISAQSIAQDITQKGADLFNSDYAYQHRLVDNSEPIIGRHPCQTWVREGSPLVRIFARRERKGLSFSVDIMRACLPASDHVIGEVLVSELEKGAHDTALLFLERLLVTGADLPESQDSDTSRGAWITNLVAAFIAAVRSHHRDRCCWIVIDDFRRHKLPDTGCRDFLSELYRQIADVDGLRVVLIGLEDPPSGFPNGIAVAEEVPDPDKGDVLRYLRMRMVAGNLDHSGTEIRRLSSLVLRAAGDEIEKLSAFIGTHVDLTINSEIEGRS